MVEVSARQRRVNDITDSRQRLTVLAERARIWTWATAKSTLLGVLVCIITLEVTNG